MHLGRLISCASTLALAAAAVPAMAQVDPATVQPGAPVTAKTPIADDVSAETPAGRAGEDIVVTARRVEESLQDVPVAIIALSQNNLNERAISNSFDLAKSVPGLVTNADSGNATLPSFSIRGRGQFFGAATGSVETYLADVPLSAPFQIPTLPPQFFDLASVQVLKGPQGTLFGRNTTGGAVLFVPQAPKDTFEGYVRGQLGTYSNRQLEAAVNLPLGDIGALRVAGFAWKRHGYARTVAGRIDSAATANAGGNALSPVGPKVILPSVGIYNQDVLEARATLRLTPFDGLENSTIVTWHGDKNLGTPQLNILRPGAALAAGIRAAFPNLLPNDPRVADIDTDVRRPRSSTWAFINTTLFDLTENLRIKNIVSHIRASGYTNNPADTDGSPFPAVNLPRQARFLKNRQYGEELQLQGNFDQFDFIIGGLIDRTRQPGADDKINQTTNTFSVGANGNDFDTQFRQSRFNSEALFGSVTFRPTDRLTVSAAARHSWDDIRERSVAINNLRTQISAIPANLAALPPCPLSNPTNITCRASNITAGEKFKGWTYNATVDLQVTDDLLVYGGYRRGYKRGGFNARGSETFLPFGPEKVDDYFVGLKSSFDIAGRRATFNIEGFYDVYDDAQRAYLDLSAGALVTTIQNVPGVRYRGFDTDMVFNLTDWFRIAANYTYVDAKFTDYPDPSLPAALAALAAAPQSVRDAFAARNAPGALEQNTPGLFNKHKLNVQGRLHHRFENGGEVAFLPSASYQSRFLFNDVSTKLYAIQEVLFNGGAPLNAAADGANVAPGYTTFDARLEFNDIADKLDMSFNVTNLTNKTFVAGGAGIYQFGVNSLSYGPPRMYFVEARYRF
jgi:iron complex outermembrane receptor protein